MSHEQPLRMNMSLFSRISGRRLPSPRPSAYAAIAVVPVLLAFLMLRTPTQVAHLQAAPTGQWSMGFWTAWSSDPNMSDLVWDALTHLIHVGVEPQSDATLKYSDPQFWAHAAQLISTAH